MQQNKSYESKFDESEFDSDNSFFDEASEMFESNPDFIDGEIVQDEPDNFLRRKASKVKKAQERKMQRINNRNERKAARKSRVELKADRNLKAEETNAKAELLSVSPATVALSEVQANQPLISSYVQQQGMVPQTNPAALSLQAMEAYQNNVESYTDSIPDYENAEDAYIDDAIQDWEGEGDAEEFFGSVISSVIKAGSELVNRINEKRTANGKKPIFAGKNWKKLAEKYNKNEEVVTDGLTAAEKAFIALTKKEIDERKSKSAVGAATDVFIDDQKKQGIKEYLPLLLIGVAVIFLIGKNS